VQEEVGLKGAKTSTYNINPDSALAIDVAPAGDFPGTKPEESRIKLNSGPVITVVDGKGRGLITHPKIREAIVKAASKGKIPFQLEVGEGGTTDATAMQLTRGGVPCGVISVPTRYIHTPVEVASLKDIKNTVRLVTDYIQNL
jgi:endoglucanase